MQITKGSVEGKPSRGKAADAKPLLQLHSRENSLRRMPTGCV